MNKLQIHVTVRAPFIRTTIRIATKICPLMFRCPPPQATLSDNTSPPVYGCQLYGAFDDNPNRLHPEFVSLVVLNQSYPAALQNRDSHDSVFGQMRLLIHDCIINLARGPAWLNDKALSGQSMWWPSVNFGSMRCFALVDAVAAVLAHHVCAHARRKFSNCNYCLSNTFNQH